MKSSQVRLQDKGDQESPSVDQSYIYPSSHKNISLDDDVWDLTFRSNIATRKSTRVSFTSFPDSVKYEVKQYIRDGILGANFSNGWASTTLVALRQAFQLLAEKHGTHFSLFSLTQDDACAIEELFCQEVCSKPRSKIATVARFLEFLREQYPDLPASFRVNPRVAPSSKVKRTYSEGLEMVIPDEVSEALMEAVGREQILLEEKIKRYRSKQPRSHYLYTVILTLLLCSGRRISETILLSRNCLRKPTHSEVAETGRGIWLIYSNTKTGLGQDEIFIGEPISDLVYRMVERVQALTEPLAVESGLDRLFLTDPKAHSSPMDEGNIYIIDAEAFRRWLNGKTTEDERILRLGFIHRYNIKYDGKYYQIDPHQARHTLAHKAYLGGATYVDVGGHLGHTHTQSGLSPMTGVYIHGHEKDVRLINQMNANRAVVGKAAPLIQDRSVVIKILSPADVAIWREQGMVVHPTHYGH